ncbi:MAG: hypothetical protein KHX22_02535 [Clostridiales bacterium]|jgi:H+-ATPase subunit H|nr:hypothetical protein [Clostridiales bacterium]PWM20689.1 MAG: hypothetical protein DBX53_08085 [Clostridiales bacterium]PWM20892.1 MAG: hypothetical protein DBX53_07920 [Clostridiales bacterium]
MELHSIEMLEELEDMIENGKKSLMSGRVSVDKNELLAVIDELKSILPDEIIQANEYYKDSRELRDSAEHEADTMIAQANKEADEIVDKAQSDAEAIIADANSEADAIVKEAHRQQAELISEHRITQMATEQGNEIIGQANERAAEIKRAMKKYLDDKLNYVSDVLAKTYNEIEANKKSI